MDHLKKQFSNPFLDDNCPMIVFIGGVTSLLFMLWSSIGGNVSRMVGITIYPKKDVSIDGCPSEWNVTMPGAANAVENSNRPAEEIKW